MKSVNIIHFMIQFLQSFNPLKLKVNNNCNNKKLWEINIQFVVTDIMKHNLFLICLHDLYFLFILNYIYIYILVYTYLCIIVRRLHRKRIPKIPLKLSKVTINFSFKPQYFQVSVKVTLPFTCELHYLIHMDLLFYLHIIISI